MPTPTPTPPSSSQNPSLDHVDQFLAALHAAFPQTDNGGWAEIPRYEFEDPSITELNSQGFFLPEGEVE